MTMVLSSKPTGAWQGEQGGQHHAMPQRSAACLPSAFPRPPLPVQPRHLALQSTFLLLMEGINTR